MQIHMANVLSTCALALAVLLACCTPGAAGPLSITVTAGQSVTLPAAGIVRVDVHPADIATASGDADGVRIFGVQPSVATLVLTTSDSVEARPIQVVAAPEKHLSLVPQGGGCPGLAYVQADFHLALGMPDLAVDWTPSTWRLEWTPPDFRVLASSALTTPLRQLGVPVTAGLQAEWHDQWRLIAGDGVGLIGYNVPGTGTLAMGGSALGPAAFVDMTLGDARVSAAALKSQAGQVLSGAQASVGAGPVNIGYTVGPAGGSPAIQVHSGSVSASAGTTPGEGVQVGLGIALTPGFTVDSSWTAAGGWRLHLAVSIGGGTVAQAGAAPARASVSYAPGGSWTYGPGCLP
jgi:hypothetical protein